MKTMTRRELIKLFGNAAIGTGLLGASNLAFAKQSAHIVIVGGGVGGAAAAKYMRLLNSDVRITIIEPQPQYIFCPGSNEVVADFDTLETLTVDYNTLKSRYAVNVIQDYAQEIDYTGKSLILAKGDVIHYDKLIVSPGPDFKYNAVEGYSKELAEGDFPAAWHAGPQTLTLRDQIKSMPQGGTVLISSPVDPYRCPPAPYERASFIANKLKHTNPTAKILILDSKDDFIFHDVYMDFWKKEHGLGTDNARIEWVPAKNGGHVTKLDTNNRTLTTASGQTLRGDVINIIPPEMAGSFVRMNGLVKGDWAPINSKDFSSKRDKDVYVIGDSAAADPMPKTGYIASNQAKVVTKAIQAELTGKEIGTPFITNNCVAMAAEDWGMTVAETFRYAGNDRAYEESYVMSNPTENPYHRHIRAEVAKNWQRTFRKDIFS
ncbi:FCSD flavin-binding domain-containing protein [Thiomicrorhabdus sp. ZW0627]|uniref:FAD-dependent oxidoreductase n=1 Tax=Thiomicrorhabdus sp. ZW0627 TaxID=3039774 RepID=UPI0024364331|nr:FCSD flavin-binding domain-containing protein [Thiomicrorhabdus sp. ZW0627]MDG6774099.1 FCSD flavin-binding domain-containing protein [Thiomicrorhabdus sp. ZW0627]